MILELKNIRKEFIVPGSDKLNIILDDLSLEVSQGESAAVTGPSGSGKSTLLNIIGSLDKPTSGSVIFDGKDISDLDESELARMRNRDIGFIFQLHYLLPQCTVLENVLIPTIPFKMDENDDKIQNRAKELLKRVGLDQQLNSFPAQLSGGELQRTAVARALINKPRLILADEPTGSLDQKSSDNLGRLLMELNEEQKITLIVVTHSNELAGLMGKQYHLQDGRLEKIL